MGKLLCRMPIFIKHRELNQYILKVQFLDDPSPTTYCG
jgi:hypothetical protein